MSNSMPLKTHLLEWILELAPSIFNACVPSTTDTLAHPFKYFRCLTDHVRFWPTARIHYPQACRRSGFSHGPRCVKSGDRGGQGTGPPLPVQRPRKAPILRLRTWVPISKLFYREPSVRSWSMAPNSWDTVLGTIIATLKFDIHIFL
jgi:hypothetical protein